MSGRKKRLQIVKKNAAYPKVLVREEKKQKKKSVKLLNLENNPCRVVTNLECYTAAAV